MTFSTPHRARWSAVAGFAALIVCVGQTAASAANDSHSKAHLTRPSLSSAHRTAAATAPSARVTGPTRWVRPERGCATGGSGEMSCDVIKLVPSHRGAAGAVLVPAPSSPTASTRSSKAADSTPSYTRGPAGGYTPADLATAYGYHPATGGTTQTVAIVDAHDDPNALANLNAFDKHYHLHAETSTSFRKVNQTGKTTPLPSRDMNWAVEITLDIQAVRSVCNHCKILLVEVTSPTAANLAAGVNTAVKLHATEVSNSYGGAETSKASKAKSVIAAYNHPGVVITASTGDDGWYDWDFANNQADLPHTSDNAPNVPAALPTVVAVGGTSLTLTSTGARHTETVWDTDGPEDSSQYSGASGGGCSKTYKAQSWQAKVAHYSTTGCGTNRATGDVAALADPATGFDIYDTFDYPFGNPPHPGLPKGWGTVGGTSLASPIIAAMWALAGGSGGVHYPSESLYYNLAHHATTVFDVKTGSNAFCGGVAPATCASDVLAGTNGGTNNPNRLANFVGAGGPAGLTDCSFPASGDNVTKFITNNKQCNATTGYDGPSGVGTPHGLSVFKKP